MLRLGQVPLSVQNIGFTVAAPANRGLSLTQQAIRLAVRYPLVDRPVLHCGRLLWTIPLQPTPISVTYTVAVDYKHGQRPDLYVVEPELAVRQGEELPHIFTENGSLCLYFGQREFDAGLTLSRTCSSRGRVSGCSTMSCGLQQASGAVAGSSIACADRPQSNPADRQRSWSLSAWVSSVTERVPRATQRGSPLKHWRVSAF